MRADSPEVTLESPRWEGAPSSVSARRRWMCTGLRDRAQGTRGRTGVPQPSASHRHSSPSSHPRIQVGFFLVFQSIPFCQENTKKTKKQ